MRKPPKIGRNFVTFLNIIHIDFMNFQMAFILLNNKNYLHKMLYSINILLLNIIIVNKSLS